MLLRKVSLVNALILSLTYIRKLWIVKFLFQKKKFLKEVVFNILLLQLHNISFNVIVTKILSYNDHFKNIFLVKHLWFYACSKRLPKCTRFVWMYIVKEESNWYFIICRQMKRSEHLSFLWKTLQKISSFIDFVKNHKLGF